MNKNLIEEIKKIKSLTSQLLNEGPGEIFSRIIGKLNRTAIEDAAITAFETLESKNLIKIDKTTKTIRSVDWARMADQDLKLLFKSNTFRKMFEEAASESGVDITNDVMTRSIGGNFKKLLSAYKSTTPEFVQNVIKTQPVSLLNKGTKSFSDETEKIFNEVSQTLDNTLSNQAVPNSVSDVFTGSMKDVVNNKIKVSDLRKISTDDLDKISKLQQLKATEKGNKISLEAQQISGNIKKQELKLKELDVKEKQIDVDLKKAEGDVKLQGQKIELKKQKIQLTRERMGLVTDILTLLWKAKWIIIGGAVIIFGWKFFKPVIENVLNGRPAFSGAPTETTQSTDNKPKTGSGKYDNL